MNRPGHIILEITIFHSGFKASLIHHHRLSGPPCFAHALCPPKQAVSGNSEAVRQHALISPTVAKILLIHRCNIKLRAYFLPGQPKRKDFIVGSVLDRAVEMRQSHMDKGLMHHLIEKFLQR
jgi:hypothetical protein